MFHFYQANVLALNPDGINASVEYFYKNLHAGVSLAFSRGGNIKDSFETARATCPLAHRQVMSILKFSMSCATLKQWLMGRINIMAHEVSFYRLENDGVTVSLIGTKVLDTQRAI